MTFIIRSEVKLPIVVSEFSDHKRLKPILLEAIQKTEFTNANGGSQDNITRTDWFCNKNHDGAGYFDILKPSLDAHLMDVYSKLHYNSVKYSGVWFQQYNNLDEHSYHRHDFTHWTNVYYLELPNGCPGTTVLDPFDYSTEFTPDVYEGYILTMPSILAHCSKPNISNKRKTVISFNIW